jgi:hypothetical protein
MDSRNLLEGSFRVLLRIAIVNDKGNDMVLTEGVVQWTVEAADSTGGSSSRAA